MSSSVVLLYARPTPTGERDVDFVLLNLKPLKSALVRAAGDMVELIGPPIPALYSEAVVFVRYTLASEF